MSQGRLSRRLRQATLGSEPEFRLLWAAQAVSQLGSEVSGLALPLAAVVTLRATPGQMGLLSALLRLPSLGYPLMGFWVDRVRRRPVLVGADLARAAILLTVPAAALLGVLRIELLYVVVVVVVSISNLFEVANQSYVPSIVRRDRLVVANSRLEVTRSTAQITGPGLGGLLVQLLTAPIAILGDALSFVISAALTSCIRTPEASPQPEAALQGVRAEIGEGIRFILGHPTLRLLVAAVAASRFLWALQLSVYLLFLSRELRIGPALIGFILLAAGPGALLGTVLAVRLPPRLGLGVTIIWGWTAFAGGALLVPMARPGLVEATLVLVASQFATAAAGQAVSINVLSLRQAATPDRLLGRVNAGFGFLATAGAPVGSLGGGLLGALVGLRQTELVAALALLAIPLLLGLSALPRLRTEEVASWTRRSDGG